MNKSSALDENVALVPMKFSIYSFSFFPFSTWPLIVFFLVKHIKLTDQNWFVKLTVDERAMKTKSMNAIKSK